MAAGGRGVEVDGEAVRRARRRLVLNQDQVCERAKRSLTTVRNMEAGGSFDAATVKAVATVLAVDWRELLSDAERERLGVEPPPPTGPTRSAAPETTFGGTGSPLGPVASTAKRVPRQLPRDLTDFVGRQDAIRQLVACFSGAGGAVGLSAVGGMGGVGKTSLAVHVAHAIAHNFPDGVLFLDLSGMNAVPMTPADAIQSIIHGFYPERVALGDEAATLLPEYRSALHGLRALIVLDNATDEAHVRDLLSAPPPVAFLITSRRRLVLDGVENVGLDSLSRDEALDLLRRIVGGRGTDAELLSLADLCGRLPLALRVAGNFVRVKSEWAVADYVSAVDGERLRWLKVGGETARDVDAVLTLSAAQLVNDDRRDGRQRATRWCVLARLPLVDFDLPVVAEAWGMSSDPAGARAELGELVDRSLLLYDGETGRYRFHDLMRPIAARLFR